MSSVTRHILSEPSDLVRQHCILCGMVVADNPIGALPDGLVFEKEGRLLLIEPDEAAVSCQQE